MTHPSLSQIWLAIAEDSGLAKKEIAKKIGISPSALSNSFKSELSWARFNAYALALGYQIKISYERKEQ